MTKNHDKNGLFILGGLEMHLDDIIWVVHDGKIMVEVRARKMSGSSQLRWVVRAERCTEGLHISLIHVRAWVRGVGL